MHISVKELWEAWLRSEVGYSFSEKLFYNNSNYTVTILYIFQVHNWTMEQTSDWLAQSVQLPQYVELFRLHKVTGATLPR